MMPSLGSKKRENLPRMDRHAEDLPQVRFKLIFQDQAANSLKQQVAISVSTSVRELEMLLQLSASPALLYSLTVRSSLENCPLAFINVTPEPSGGYKGSPQREGRLLRHFLTSSIHADFPAVSSFPQRDLCFYPETRQTASDLRKAACSCNSVCLTRCTA